MKNVVIVGGNGSIGSAVAARFLEKGDRVTCFNRGLSGKCPNGVETIIGDRHDMSHFETTMQKRSIDVAIDLTCYNAEDAQSSALAFQGSGRLFQISTVATYGRTFRWYPTSEDHEQKPTNDYGRGKLAADNLLLSCYYERQLPVTIIKPSICFGPKFGLLRQLGQDLTWISRILAGRPIIVSGDGMALHQFLHVDDFAVALYSLVDCADCIGQVVNLVNPHPVSWRDYHQAAMAALGHEVEMVGVPAPTIYRASLAAGCPVSDIFSHNSFFSAEKFRRYSDFLPQMTLQEGVARVTEELLRQGRLPPLDGLNWEDRLIAEQSQIGVAAAPVALLPADGDVAASTTPALSLSERLIEEMLRPPSDAPQESRIVKLVEEGFRGWPYNIVRYIDQFWALHWAEGEFNLERMLAGGSAQPVLIAESVEELGFALDRLRAGAPQMRLECLESPPFKKIREQLFLVSLSLSDIAATDLAEVPAIRNRYIPTEDLFASTSDEPIMIISPAPSRTCNYRCEYCYNHDYGFNKNTDATASWSAAILMSARRIRRPIRYSAGAMGEPLFIPKWRETAIELLAHDNVLSLAFVSNLSQEIDDFFTQVDPQRIGLMASLHPTEFKDHDRDFFGFLGKLAKLQKLGVALVVNYVLTPDQVRMFPFYRSKIIELGIPMTSNVLRGPYRGKMYPRDFSEDELAIVKTCYDENSYIFDSQSHYRNPYGLECISGYRGFYLEFDGGFFNCHFARQRLGSIYDESLMVRRKPGFCTAQKCESQTTIGWQADIAKKFRVQRTLHHYTRIE